MIRRRQNARRGGELWSSDFAANGARGDLDLRIVPDALRLSHIAPGHHIKLVRIFTEPHRRRHAHSIFAKGRERDVFLTADGGWNGLRHKKIVIPGDPTLGKSITLGTAAFHGSFGQDGLLLWSLL